MKSRILGLFSILLLVSCKVKDNAQNDLNYMQNIEQVAIESSAKNSGNTIQTGDQLVVLITAKDMDVVKPFNQSYSSSEIVQPNNVYAGGNMTNQGISTVPGPTYIVDNNGNIDFPVIGAINTIGKTLVDVKNELREKVSHYVINPTVSIRLTNFKITVLGEVNRQGDYVITNGHATILNALGLAGDLTGYGKRTDVLVIRTENGTVTHGRINLQDANLINSPYYNLKQGDAIIVQSTKAKEIVSRQNPNTGLYLTAISIGVTAIAVVVGLFKK
ncbi:polysaccharide biosynthesis/export family protein [Chryseobacterium jejuense]|uniref:Polysaccharide export outer membrane protein n=1 Tax=Chryseobacterium jejuense TaxID=445960 RepID=A0A2X2X1K0_CHRJE|nr:polysaccharide biosynthesis/export family protein [Chryseobacterium jejuense]SDJ35436.1 polysaccharide export outer membrane protein [Chryseobacterium jejuense]SQB45787.1 polysaccharide export protein Wza [Chryseobacterium jejuense]